MPRVSKQINKDDPEYLEKRAKNNEAIKRTRDKAKVKAKETETKLENLKTDNKRMENQISVLDREMQFLKDVYHTHTQGTIENCSAVGVAGNEDQNTQNQDSENNIQLLNTFLNQN